ncbi:dihydroneopterin aldolase [Psychrosphaera haliotis]|uniref:7,8-dihydroneopterin aldolase n=1 Tax=Psychrosphaera haliotis TaxID=555083 RepID=A0A6N8FBJ8_9GAMM|nr:dihydroneopterin aldolase [Psychrosphaera haliotis]MUH72370.1 dihydroneopterin aldolase [Psychrosphaera haliotis]
MTQDIVFIEALKVDTVIGVYDWEKSIQQTLQFDVEMRTDIRAAAEVDDLSKTVDYAVVSEDIVKLAKENQAELIETVAEKVAERILTHYAVNSVQISLRKLGAVASTQSVGVRIERDATLYQAV